MFGRAALDLRRIEAPSGEGQTRITLSAMRAVVRSAVRNPRVVNTAVHIVEDVHGSDALALATRLASWVRQSMQFLPDPVVNGDWIRTPEFILHEITRRGIARGDCDDAAVLVASLAMAVGLRARFNAVAFSPGGYEHVWTDVLVGDKWYPIDPTREQPLPDIHRSMLMEID